MKVHENFYNPTEIQSNTKNLNLHFIWCQITVFNILEVNDHKAISYVSKVYKKLEVSSQTTIVIW